MATLIVPPIERDELKSWQSLGDQVADWLERNAVWGPGSKFGQPVTVDDEFHAWLLRAYQVFPRNHAREGRRRFDMCAAEQAKGTGKSERAIQVGQAELSPSAPVRVVGWERVGRVWRPVGGGVPYPRLIFVAYSEDQVMRTAFGRFREALKRSPLRDQYHITAERIVLLGEDGAANGEAYPLAVSGSTADGDLPTWQHIDEPHRWTEPRHHEMVNSIGENALKDVTADAWTMTTSTAGEPGENSVEEELLATAEAVARGEVERSSLFFFRRYAPEDMPMETAEDVEAFVREARGPAAEWSGDIPRIVNRWFDPKVDKSYWRRVWGNQWVKGAGRAFDPQRWEQLTRPDISIPAGAFVGVGFDGARRRDATGIVVTDIVSGRQEVHGVWERPLNAADDWEVPATEVDDAMSAVFDRFEVWRLYADPPYWDDWVTVWEGRWGEERAVRWWTNQKSRMAHALRRYRTAMDTGAVTHDDDEVMARHVANARKLTLHQRDEQDVELWVIRKDRADSLDKIDLAMAGCLSWQVRCDAITKGAKPAARAVVTVPARLR